MLNFLTGLAGVGITVSVFIILLAFLRRPMRSRFTAACRYTLWVILILRLCVPIGTGLMPRIITFSEEENRGAVQNITQTHKNKTISADMAYDQSTAFEAANPLSEGASVSNAEIGNAVNDNTAKAENTAEAKEEIAQEKAFTLDAKTVTAFIFTVWAAGCVTFVTAALIQYNNNARLITRNLLIPGNTVKEKYKALCKAEGIKNPPDIYFCRVIKTPMVYGFFKSRVILPELQLPEKELECILRHELVHYTRHDLYIKLVALIANAMHWFNPFVYMAVKIMTREMELSCDEQALDILDKHERLSYGESMLQIVRYCKGTPILTTGFDTGRRAVKERFENILNFKRKRKGYMAVAFTLALCLLSGSIIGCAELTPTVSQAKETQKEQITSLQKKTNSNENLYIDFADVPEAGWSLSYDTDTLILKHDDGRAFRYTDDRTQGGDGYSLAFYPITNTDASLTVAGNYAFIIYNAPVYSVNDEQKHNLVIAELSRGRIIERVDITAADMISFHSLPMDILAAYESSDFFNPLYDIAFEVNTDAENKRVCLNVTLETYDDNYIISACSYFDYENAVMSSFTPVMGVEPYEVNCINDINEIERMSGLDENAVMTVRAFLNKDIAKLEELCGYENGMYSDYSTLMFGDYRISRKGGIYLRLDVDITQSSVDGLEVGRHTFFYQNFIGCYMEHACGHYSHIAANEASKEAETWLMISNDPEMPYKKESAESKYAAVEYITYKYGVLTPEQYSEKAAQIFAMNNVNVTIVDYGQGSIYSGGEGVIYQDGVEAEGEDRVSEEIPSYYTDFDVTTIFVSSDGNMGRGGVLYFYDIIETSQENGIYTATFQFYADYAKTLKAQKITYTFRRQGDMLIVAGENSIENQMHRNFEMYIV